MTETPPLDGKSMEDSGGYVLKLPFHKKIFFTWGYMYIHIYVYNTYIHIYIYIREYVCIMLSRLGNFAV